MPKRVQFDFHVAFTNGGELEGRDFRLDIDGGDITDEALGAYVVRDLRLLMAGPVTIRNKRIIEEAHKRAPPTYRLHYRPGACSLAVHAVLREINADIELVDHSDAAGGTQSAEYLAVNPRGRVPALEVNGAVYTETAAILLTLGERHAEAGLLPPAGSTEKFRALEWMNYLASTLHPLYWGVWRAHRLSDEETHHPVIARTVLRDLERRYTDIDQRLRASRWIAGDALSVADFYLYVFTRWTRRVELPHAKWPRLNEHYAAMNERASIRDALAAEGLVPL